MSLLEKINGIILKNKNEQLELTLHSGISQMSYTLDATGVKIWFYLVSRVFNRLDSQQQIYSLPASELFDYLETRNYEHINKILLDIQKTNIKFTILGKNKSKNWMSSVLLSTVGIKDGLIIFEIPIFLKQQLLDYKEMFVIINLMLLRDFKSKHSLGLYVVLSDYLIKNLEQTEKILGINELKELLGVNILDYPEYKIFNRDVIKKAIDEINEKSNLIVSYKIHEKENKKIKSLKFTFHIKKQLPYLKSYTPSQIDLNNDFDTKSILEFSIDNNKNDDLVKIFPKDDKIWFYLNKYRIIIDNSRNQDRIRLIAEKIGIENIDNFFLFIIDITKSKENEIQKNIDGDKNIAGFFIGCLKSDDYLNSFYFELQELKKKEENRRKLIEIKVKNKINDNYILGIKNDFVEYLIKNIDQYENIFISNVSKLLKPGTFLYDVIIGNLNNGKIDRTLLTKRLPHEKDFIMNEIEKNNPKFREEINYTEPTFEEWKKRTVTDEYLTKIKKEIEDLL